MELQAKGHSITTSAILHSNGSEAAIHSASLSGPALSNSKAADTDCPTTSEDRISVTCFGAVADYDPTTGAGTDNYAAFMAAEASGRRISIPAGAYGISRGIPIYNSMDWRGDWKYGSQIGLLAAYGNGLNRCIICSNPSASSISNVAITGITLLREWTNALHGITFDNASNVVLDLHVLGSDNESFSGAIGVSSFYSTPALIADTSTSGSGTGLIVNLAANPTTGACTSLTVNHGSTTSGYVTGDTITVSGGDGNCTATVTASGGSVSALSITNGGLNYSFATGVRPSKHVNTTAFVSYGGNFGVQYGNVYAGSINLDCYYCYREGVGIEPYMLFHVPITSYSGGAIPWLTVDSRAGQLNTGDPLIYWNGLSSGETGDISGLLNGRTYFAIPVSSSNSVQLAASPEDAIAGIAIPIGSGTVSGQYLIHAGTAANIEVSSRHYSKDSTTALGSNTGQIIITATSLGYSRNISIHDCKSTLFNTVAGSANLSVFGAQGVAVKNCMLTGALGSGIDIEAGYGNSTRDASGLFTSQVPRLPQVDVAGNIVLSFGVAGIYAADGTNWIHDNYTQSTTANAYGVIVGGSGVSNGTHLGTNYSSMSNGFSLGYLQKNVSTTGGSGSGLQVNILSNPATGACTSLSVSSGNAGSGYVTGDTITSSVGSGCTATVTASNGAVTAISSPTAGGSGLSSGLSFNYDVTTFSGLSVLHQTSPIVINSASSYGNDFLDVYKNSVKQFSINNGGVVALTAVTNTTGSTVLSTTQSSVQSVTDNTSLTLQTRNMSSAGIPAVLVATGADTQSSGVGAALEIKPTVNQTGSASHYDLWINRTDTASGSGTQRLVSAGSGGSSYVEKWGLDRNGNTYPSGFSTQPIQSAIPSAATIAPASPTFHVTGTAAISTITVPSACSVAGYSCTLHLIPDDAFTTTTSGNIAFASTATVGRALELTYDPSSAKWYPSY